MSGTFGGGYYAQPNLDRVLQRCRLGDTLLALRPACLVGKVLTLQQTSLVGESTLEMDGKGN